MLYSVNMNKAFEKACELVGSAALAVAIDVSPQAISAVKKGKRAVPIPWCPIVEDVTGGAVTRCDLRPHDWQKLWPELEKKKPLSRRKTDVAPYVRKYLDPKASK